MKAAIIALGSELLGITKLDKNSLHITAELEHFGVKLLGKSIIGDDEKTIGDTLKHWIPHTDMIIITGGLGPTTDDVTRDAVAEALGKALTPNPILEEQICRRFTSMGRQMADINRKQAMMIQGGTTLENARGTAPGIRIKHDGTTIFLFPGVPREADYMVETHLRPWLQKHASAGGNQKAIERAVLKVACLPESEVEQRIFPAYEEFGREWITILGSPGEVTLHLKTQGKKDHCQKQLQTMQERMRKLVGDAIFTDKADASLEHIVGELLTSQKKTLATAESCTGGLLAERLTRIPGSSAYFLGGLVTYSDNSKADLLEIPKDTIQKHGAVSEAVAKAMAQQVRIKYSSDYGIGITGVAGPDGGSETKPAGTIHITLAGPGDEDIEHQHKRFPGDRERVRSQSAQWALNILRQAL